MYYYLKKSVSSCDLKRAVCNKSIYLKCIALNIQVLPINDLHLHILAHDTDNAAHSTAY